MGKKTWGQWAIITFLFCLPLFASAVTIDELNTLANQRKDSVLEEIFEKAAVPIKCLPAGPSRGLSSSPKITGMAEELNNLVTLFAGKNWLGKRFITSEGCQQVGAGVNRFNSKALLVRQLDFDFFPLVEEKSFYTFTTSILEDGKTVVLNYSGTEQGPLFGPGELLQAIGLRDTIRAIPVGDNTDKVIYIGRVELFGQYVEDSEQYVGGKFVSWFFLDFN